MTNLASLQWLLAAQVLCTSLPAQEPTGQVLTQVRFRGGSGDDEAFARAAAALVLGQAMDADGFRLALEAIRATDRFRTVAGTLKPEGRGQVAEIQLDPWPALRSLKLEGLPSLGVAKGAPRGLHLGDCIGERRLEAWRRHYQTQLQESGYPEATVSCDRQAGGLDLRVRVIPGRPSLVTRVEVAGRLAPYSAEKLIRLARVVPGRTLWTAWQRIDSLGRLRRKFQADKRYEGTVELDWQADGLLRLRVNPGPVVRLQSEGDSLSLGWDVGLKDMVPLARAGSYSPEILDEGERRIVRALRGKGYLDAQVSHRREVLRTGPNGPEEVRVTYSIHRGQRNPVRAIHFERNKALTEAELIQAAALPSSWFSPSGPTATPDLVDAVEARVKALYLSKGYKDASIRLQPLQQREGGTELLFRVSEGSRHLMPWLRMELPAGGFGDPWGLGECLSLVLSDRPLRLGPVSGTGPRRYGSDRPGLAGVEATLESHSDPARAGAITLTLRLNRPIPLQKSDLAKIYSLVRQQRLTALGVVQPVVRFNLEPADGGTGVVLDVPNQPVERVRRLVVQGSDKTRARAVLREAQVQPGAPLDLGTITRAQSRLSYLGAFQRVDFASMAEPLEEPSSPAALSESAAAGAVDARTGPAPRPDSGPGSAPSASPVPAAAANGGPPVPWRQGDLLLRLEERPPWVVTSGFGYDRSQGYHLGLGVQRLNFGGMGRTLDFGIRAGDGTIDSQTLRKFFPTGTYDRSVDSFSVGYSDPWFAPGALEGWLPDRTRLNAEAAYIQERRSLYLLRRRRLVTSLQWLVSPQVSIQAGYRFERVDVAAALKGIDSEQLAIYARYPTRATISAPYLQLARDTRDNPFDPTRGSYSVARVELANQMFLTSPNNSFVKLDLRQQWTWPLGREAAGGVVALGLRLGMARPTAASAESLPLSERFFGGGPFSQRGVEPDGLGPLTRIPLRETSPPYLPRVDSNGKSLTESTPLGGQGLVLVNLEYRFPIGLLGRSVWGEVFVDSGQVYERLSRQSVAIDPAAAATTSAQFPPLRTSLGVGLIFKVSIPIKLEYAADLKRILGQPRTSNEVDTQLKGLLLSAGFQF